MRTAGTPGLVGRDRELHDLLAAVKWAPSVVLVEGEAGVGKSRLVGELSTRVPGRFALARCRAPRDPYPLGVVVDLLSSIGPITGPLPGRAGLLRPLLPELADRLPPPPASGGRLADAARDVLAALGPATIVVEDLHCADDDTLELLRCLVSDPVERLSLVVTARPEDLSGAASSTVDALRAAGALVRLRPLGTDAVRELAGLVTGAEVSAEAAEVLTTWTNGLPFLVEQVLAAPRRAPDLGRATARRAAAVLDALAVPPLVHDAALARVGALDGAARALAEASAVLGGPASAEVLCAVAGTGAPADVAGLVRRAVLHEVEPGRYDHRVPLLRRAVRENVPAPDRTVLHRRALHVLAGVDAPAARLAGHARAAGAEDDWVRHGLRAAEEAVDDGEQEAAIALLHDLAAGAGRRPAVVGRLVSVFCRCALSGTRHGEVVAALRDLRADPRLPADAVAEIDTTVALLRIRLPGELAQGTRGVRTVPHPLTDRWLRGAAVLAMPYLGTRSARDCRRWQDVIAHRITRMPPGLARTTLLASTLQAVHEIGAPGAEDLIALLPRDVDPDDHEHLGQLARAHGNLADALTWSGHYALAREHLSAGLRDARAAGALYVRASQLATELRLDWLSGDWAGLDQRARALAEANPHSMPVVSDTVLVQGWLALANGDWERAQRCFLATRMTDPASAVAPVAIAAGAGMVELRLSRGDVAGAEAFTDAAVELLRRKGIWSWAGDLVPVAVQALTAAGRRADAVELTVELAAALREVDAPHASAALTSAQAHLAPGRAGFDAAAAEYRTLDLPYHAARHAELAARLPPTDTAALHHLAGAYEEMGAPVAAARCRHLSRTEGAAVPSRRGRRGYGNTLSPRETDIAAMLTRGCTNEEIAETLFLSRRTVEHHVAGVLRKLRTTRRDLAG